MHEIVEGAVQLSELPDHITIPHSVFEIIARILTDTLRRLHNGKGYILGPISAAIEQHEVPF